MTDLVPFEFDGFGACRFGADDDGTPWVVASDFAKLMGYAKTQNATDAVDADEKGHAPIVTPGGLQRVAVFYEDGILELIFQSKLPGAKAIKARVKAILKAIRETGGYGQPMPPALPDRRQLAQWVIEAENRAEVAEAKVAVLEPAAKSWTALADAGGDYSVREAAQILDRDPAISTGQKRLFAYLREIGWLDARSEPYQAQVECGRLVRRATGGYDRDGVHVATWQARITTKGLHELHKRLGGTGQLLLPT